jgi:hypothetical protein
MANLIPLDFNQPTDNELSKIAEEQRKKLFPKNDYNTANQYSSTNPDALANGDELGRGTGGFLDVYNNAAGTITDNVERKNEIKTNRYNSTNTYPNFEL